MHIDFVAIVERVEDLRKRDVDGADEDDDDDDEKRKSRRIRKKYMQDGRKDESQGL